MIGQGVSECVLNVFFDPPPKEHCYKGKIATDHRLPVRDDQSPINLQPFRSQAKIKRVVIPVLLEYGDLIAVLFFELFAKKPKPLGRIVSR